MSKQSFPAFVKELYINKFVFNFLSCSIAMGMMTFMLFISWIEFFRGSQSAVIGIFASSYCIFYLFTKIASTIHSKVAATKMEVHK